MKISRFSIRHMVITGMILITIVVFGIYSVIGMNVAFVSEINTPTVFVVAVYPGASAEEIVTDVVDILEDNFATLPNLKTIDSVSKNSYALITVTYRDGIDPYGQLEEIRNRITQLGSELPEGLQGRPEAFVGGTDLMPIASFTVDGGDDIASVKEYLEDRLKPQITRIPGVSTVSISGGNELRLNIKLRVDDLISKKISIAQVYQILNYSNVSFPLGKGEYKGRTIDIRYDGNYNSLEEVKNIPVGMSESKRIIYLSDVADISIDYPEKDFYITNGDKSVIIVQLMKRGDGNTIEIIKSLKNILRESTESSSGTIKYKMISDDSKTVSASLKTVITSGIIGVIAAILIIYIFLGDIKATFIIALSIPLSILMSFIGMRVVGISINLMSLSGLVAALGSVVNGSIVVIEQVYRHYKKTDERGKSLIGLNQCIFTGSEEVGKSVFGSTMTTVVVFIPIAMLNGLIGQILYEVAMTFMMALLSSIIVAIIFVPFFLKLFLPDEKRKKQKNSLLNKIINKIESFYKQSLKFVIKDTKFIIIIAVIIITLTVYSLFQLSLSFIPSTDNSDFFASIRLPTGYSLERTRAEMKTAEKLLKDTIPEIDTLVVYTGRIEGSSSEQVSPNTGYIHVLLVPVAERDRGIHEIIRNAQVDLASNIPDAEVKVTNGGFDKLVGYAAGGGGYGLTLVGSDGILLYQTALRLQEQLKKDPEVMSTALNASYDTQTAVIDATYDHLSGIGLTSYEAGITTAILYNGVDIGKYNDKKTGNRYDIRLFSDASDLPINENTLNSLQVVSAGSGEAISFSNISKLVTETTPNQINHKNRAQTITISAITTGESAMGVTQRLDNYIKNNPLPYGVDKQIGGIGEFINDSIFPILSALVISIFMVYFVMVLQFERFAQPLLILLTIPFCVIGVVIALLAFDSSLSLFSMFGIISLGGMAVNNGIILIDYMNMLRYKKRDNLLIKKGISFNEDTKRLGLLSLSEEIDTLANSINEGAPGRLIPILMATLTTMLGVVPMAIATGEGAELYAPLGQSIAGGLVTSTIISIYLIPALYFIMEKYSLTKHYRRKKTLHLEENNELKKAEYKQNEDRA